MRKRKMVDAETVALKRRKRASGTIEEERGMEVWDRRERERERKEDTEKRSETEKEIERNAGKLETAKWRGAK